MSCIFRLQYAAPGGTEIENLILAATQLKTIIENLRGYLMAVTGVR